jgi:membrane protease YdiL (CAAX protease family)
MENTKWRILDIFVVLAIYAVAMTMFYGIGAALFGTDILDGLNSPPWFSVLEGLVEFSVFVFLPVLIVTRAYKAKVKEIGLETLVSLPAVWVGIFSGAVLWATVLLVNYLIESVFGPGPTHPDIERLSATSSAIDYLLLSFPVLILTPISEEVYARGFVYTILRKRYGIVAAMVASSVLFAAFHLSLWFFLQAFVAALGLAWLREKYNSIAPAIVAHAVVNLLAALIT